MKKLSYKKPLVEVMEFEVNDILTSSIDGVSTVSLSEFNSGTTSGTLGVNSDGQVVVN